MTLTESSKIEEGKKPNAIFFAKKQHLEIDKIEWSPCTTASQKCSINGCKRMAQVNKCMSVEKHGRKLREKKNSSKNTQKLISM